MQRLTLLVLFLSNIWFCYAIEPDMIVLQSGESLKVYNIDITSGENIYFTLEEDSDCYLQRIIKEDVLIIKKADGTKIDPSKTNENTSEQQSSFRNMQQSIPNKHEPITVNAIETCFIELQTKDFKEPQSYILIKDTLDNILNLRLLSLDNNTLSIAKPRKGKTYNNCRKIIIPEYVLIKGEKYVITEIDSEAFYHRMTMGAMSSKRRVDLTLEHVEFPSTLRVIGPRAFMLRNSLDSVILPEGLEEIGSRAFYKTGYHSSNFKLYVPQSVKYIGEEAFENMSSNTSPRGFYQGFIMSLPDWINIENCTIYGIDNKAVDEYIDRIRIKDKRI